MGVQKTVSPRHPTLKSRRPNQPILRKPQVEVEVEVVEEENEGDGKMNPPGKAVFKRVNFLGMIKSFVCISWVEQPSG